MLNFNPLNLQNTKSYRRVQGLADIESGFSASKINCSCEGQGLEILAAL